MSVWFAGWVVGGAWIERLMRCAPRPRGEQDREKEKAQLEKLQDHSFEASGEIGGASAGVGVVRELRQ